MATATRQEGKVIRRLRLRCKECGLLVHSEQPKTCQCLDSHCFTEVPPGSVFGHHEIEVKDDDLHYCASCGTRIQQGRAGKHTFMTKCACTPHSDNVVRVPRYTAFVYDERPAVDMRAIRDRRQFHHVTVCNICDRPCGTPYETPHWKCRACGNINKDETTRMKIPFGCVHAWSEQRLSAHCNVKLTI